MLHRLLTIVVGLLLAAVGCSQGDMATVEEATTPASGQTTSGLFVGDADVVEVSMELVGAEGVATTCGPLLMRLASDDETVTSSKVLLADGFEGTSVPRLFLVVSDELSWQREYPEPRSGSGFGLAPDECHGGMIEGSTGTEQGMLSLFVEEGAVRFLWHFDYWREDSTVREHFTLTNIDSSVEWTSADGVSWTTEVASNFVLSWFLRVGEQLVHDYEAFEGNPRLLDFRITATPKPGIVVPSPEPQAVSDTAVTFMETWNQAAQKLEVASVALYDAKASQDPGGLGGGVVTEWKIATGATDARLTYITDPDDGILEVGIWIDSGYDTDPGGLWLQNATRVLIAVMEPDLSDRSADDLVTRFLASDFGYEETTNTVFIYQGGNPPAFILASPMAR